MAETTQLTREQQDALKELRDQFIKVIPAGRDQVVQNIIETETQKPAFARAFQTEAAREQAKALMLKTAREILADPVFQAQEKVVHLTEDLFRSHYNALAERYRQAERVSRDEADGQPTFNIDDLYKQKELPISKRLSPGKTEIIIKKEEKDTHDTIFNLAGSTRKQAEALAADFVAKELTEPFAIEAVKNAVAGSDRSIFTFGKPIYKITFNDLQDESVITKMKENHPTLFGADGKLPEEVFDALYHAQANDGKISAEEYAQIEKLVVPNVKPAGGQGK